MARKKNETADPPANGASFEEALSELEEIVAAMEEEQLPLEELVARYEKGSKLLARCETVLASARKRLQTISAQAAAEAASARGGEDRDSPDVDDETADPAALPDDQDDDDDIRLF